MYDKNGRAQSYGITRLLKAGQRPLRAPNILTRMAWQLLRIAALGRVSAGVTLAVVICLLLVPNTFLRFLRLEYRWIGSLMHWVEAQSSTVNLAHLVAFIMLGFAVKLAMVARTRTLLLGFAGVAIVSEAVQFVVPGRTPRVSDVALDLAGAVAGIGCAGLLLWLAGQARHREHSRPMHHLH